MAICYNILSDKVVNVLNINIIKIRKRREKMGSINIKVDSIEDLQGIKKRIKKLKSKIRGAMIKAGIDYKSWEKQLPIQEQTKMINQRINRISKEEKNPKKKQLNVLKYLRKKLLFLIKLEKAKKSFYSKNGDRQPRQGEKITIKNHLDFLKRKSQLRKLEARHQALLNRKSSLTRPLSFKKREKTRLQQEIIEIKEAIAKYKNSRNIKNS